MLLVLTRAGQVQAQEGPWSGQVSLLSAWVVRGIQLSDDGTPVVSASLDGYDSSGWSAGGSALLMRSKAGRRSAGWSLRLRHDWSLTDQWNASLTARTDSYLGDAALRGWCYNEIGSGVSYSDVWNAGVGLRTSSGPGCPANAPGRPRLSLDTGIRLPVRDTWAVEVGLGRLVAPDAGGYTYGNAGLSTGMRALEVHVGAVWTQGIRRDLYGAADGLHWVAGLVRRF